MIAMDWDVGGTLVDSELLHLRMQRQVCRAHDVKLAVLGSTSFVGVAISEVWRLLAPRLGDLRQTNGGDDRDRREEEQNFRAAALLQYFKGAHTLQVRLEALRFVKRLAIRSVRQLAVSNSELEIVEADLQALGLDDVQHAKPHAAPYHRVFARLRLPAAAIWEMGDSFSCLTYACVARLPTVLVTNTPDAAKTWGRDVTRAYASLLELRDLWLSAADPILSGNALKLTPNDPHEQRYEPQAAGGDK